jgi:ABC-type bacteriocin/lantibiotic exporter with double-glycine peptidase domain
MHLILKIFKLAKLYQPFSLYVFILIFAFTSILEMFGIGMMLPLIAIILDQNFLVNLSNPPYSFNVPQFFLITNYDTLLIIICSTIVLLYFFKHLLILFSVYLISNFVGKIKANLTNRLMSNYLAQSYLYHTTKKNSEINMNINQRVESIATSSISSLLYIASEVLIVVSLLILIFIFKQEKVFFIIFFFLLCAVLISKFLSKKIKKFGKIRKLEQSKKFESFTNLHNNIREVILLGKKNFAFLDFFNSQHVVSKLDAKFNTLQRAPFSLFELMGLLGLIMTIFYLKYSLNYAPVQIIAVCTFFAAISYRIIPSLNKIIFYYYQIKYTHPVFEIISKELNLNAVVKFHEEKIKFEKSISLKNIFFEYDSKKAILKNVNLDIKKKSIIGIVGKSGSGKTTLLDIISGLLFPTSGFYKVDDVLISNYHLSRKVQNIISYASQKATVLCADLRANICFGISDDLIDDNKYEKIIDIAMLRDFVNSGKADEQLSDFGKNISGGQLQRIGIARALYFDKEIMIFDESTSSLDNETEREIIKNIKDSNFGKTIIIVSHRIENLKYCEKIYEIKDGSIFLRN